MKPVLKNLRKLLLWYMVSILNYLKNEDEIILFKSNSKCDQILIKNPIFFIKIAVDI